jgi:fatty-acyl-CoA synthase
MAASRGTEERPTMQATPSRVELSPLNFLKRAADTMGGRTAVVHGERRYTYGELQARCNRLASGLWNRGIERNDRVAVLCPNTPALLEAHYGVPLAGAILVAINTRLSKDEVAYILEDSGAKILIVDHELQKMIEGVDLKGIETIVV